MAIKIEFDTAPFYRSHMKDPKGRGSWAFDLGIGDIAFSPSMTYSEAKRWAKSQFEDRTAVIRQTTMIDYHVIKVLP